MSMRRLVMRLVAVLLLVGCAWAPGQEQPDVQWHWEHAGWGGGGFFWPSAFHPVDPDIIYMGGDVAGMYKTTDGGRQWRFVNNGLPHYVVYAIAISKSQPDTLYIMTMGGMAKTTDGGANWVTLPQTLQSGLDIRPERHRSVVPVAIDPTDPDIVYVGDRKGRLFKSTDGGQNWQPINYLPDDQPEDDASAGASTLQGITLLADFETAGDTEGWRAQTQYKGFQLAKNATQSTTAAYSGQGSLAVLFQSGRGDWSNAGRVARVFNNGQMPGADWSSYRKITARFHVPEGAPRLQAHFVLQTGEKWAWQDGPWADATVGGWAEVSMDLTKVPDIHQVRAVYFIIRSTERGYDGNVYLDAVALHTDADSTVPRTSRRVATSPGMIASVVISEHDPRVVFVCNNLHGILNSRDGGETWTRLGTPPASHVAISPHDPQLIAGAFGDDGVMISRDGGETWMPVGADAFKGAGGLRQVAFHSRDPNRLYAYTRRSWESSFFRSDDGGQTWTRVRGGQPDFAANPTLPQGGGGFSAIACMTVSPTDSDRIFLSGNWRNWLSTDGGQTFHETARGADISCIQDIRFHKGKVYAVAMDEGLLVSEDNGASWRQLYPLKHIQYRSGHHWRVAVTGESGSERIIATVTPWESDQPNGILISEDGGKTFTYAREGLPTQRLGVNVMWDRGYARALAVDPNDPQTIYLGIDGDPEPARNHAGGGVFKSTDGGKTWQQLPNQPTSRRMFFGLVVDPTDSRRLYWGACNENGGVYRSDDGGETWQLVFDKEKWVFNLAVGPSGEVYAGHTELWRSTDHGQTWTHLTNFGTGEAIVGLEIDPQNPNRIWVSKVSWGGDVRGGIFRTTDGGQTWESILGDNPYVKPLVLRYNSETKELWAGGVGLFKLRQD